MSRSSIARRTSVLAPAAVVALGLAAFATSASAQTAYVFNTGTTPLTSEQLAAAQARAGTGARSW